MRDGGALLRAEGLVVQRGGLGCDITLTAGARVGVLGASESGKTAVLRALAALQPPIAGRLYWDAVDVTRKSRWRLGKRRFFVTLLSTNPYTSFEPWGAVRQFVGNTGRASEAQAERLRRYRIPVTVVDGQVKALSGVGRVRLALLYALQNDPQVVLVDDVFRMVVPEVWGQLLAEFDAQVGAARGLVVASRFWQVLTGMDDVLVLYKGNVVEWGARTVVFSQPQHPYTQWLLAQDISRCCVSAAARVAEKRVLEPQEVAPNHWVRWL